MRIIVNPTVYRPGTIPIMNVLLNCTIHGADSGSRETALIELLHLVQAWKTKHSTNGAETSDGLEHQGVIK